MPSVNEITHEWGKIQVEITFTDPHTYMRLIIIGDDEKPTALHPCYGSLTYS